MAQDLDPIERARLRDLKRKTAREQAEQKEKDSLNRTRGLEEQYDFRRAVVLGTNVRDKWATLSPGAQAEISAILAAADLSKPDKFKLAAYLPKPVPDAEIIDFAPTRPSLTDAAE